MKSSTKRLLFLIIYLNGAAILYGQSQRIDNLILGPGFAFDSVTIKVNQEILFQGRGDYDNPFGIGAKIPLPPAKKLFIEVIHSEDVKLDLVYYQNAVRKGTSILLSIYSRGGGIIGINSVLQKTKELRF